MLYLRNQPPNLARYLPQFLQEDEHFKATLAVCSTEHEKYRLLLDEITNQFYIETATWGLADWERILDLKPDASDNYEQRRNRILLKLQGKQTSTVAFLTNLIKRYCTEKSKVTVIEDNEHYMFHAEITDGTVSYADNLLDALNTYKPAHLGFAILMPYSFALEESDRLHYGLADLHQGRKTINLTHPPDATVHAYNGVAYLRMGRERIGAGTQPPPAPIAYYEGSFFSRVGRVEIPFDPADIGSTYVNRLYPAGGDYYLGSVHVRLGKKTVTIATPIPSGAEARAGIATTRGGHMRIGAGSVPPVLDGELQAGICSARSGRITIPHDPADVHDTHDHTLYPAGIAQNAGTAELRIGRKHILQAIPQETLNHTTTGSIHLRVGYIRINSKEDKE